MTENKISTEKNPFIANDVETAAIQPSRFIGSSRFAICIVFMLGMALFYACRADMSVAILCMVNHTALAGLHGPDNASTTNETTTIINPNCIRGDIADGPVQSEDGPYIWDSFTQNHILGAFFFGYPILQIPGGWAAGYLGGRWIIFACLFSLGLATLLTPFLTSQWILVAIIRAIQGLASGAVFPAAHSIVSQWAPPLERSMITTIAYSGTQLGNVFTFPVSGILCRFMGWESVFFFWGVLTLLWLVLWLLFAYNKPIEHPRISAHEKKYIVDSIGNSVGNTKMNLCAVPWLEFIKSPTVWAIFFGNFTSDWGAYTFLTQTPRYMKTVHHFDIASNSSMSALPYIGYWLCISMSGPIIDCVRERGWLSTAGSRRASAIVGFLCPSALLIILGYLHCEYWLLALIILILIISFSGFQYASWVVSHVDIAPKYAGILYGICNSLSSTAGILTSAVSAQIMSPNPTLEEWRMVFFLTALIMTIGCAGYCIFIRGEVQSWALEENEPADVKPEMVALNDKTKNDIKT